MSPLQAFLYDLHEKYSLLNEGRLASYIPELTKADPKAFGISVVTTDGKSFQRVT